MFVLEEAHEIFKRQRDTQIGGIYETSALKVILVSSGWVGGGIVTSGCWEAAGCCVGGGPTSACTCELITRQQLYFSCFMSITLAVLACVMPLIGRLGLYSWNRVSVTLSTSSSVSGSNVFLRRPTARPFAVVDDVCEAVSLGGGAIVERGRIERLNFQCAGPAQNCEMLSSGRYEYSRCELVVSSGRISSITTVLRISPLHCSSASSSSSAKSSLPSMSFAS
uniref:Uncharacterized protein n=1 Tax=Anopheles coluzzii TaxID=1518534 RepID=A0A8W7Q1I3_ANOCL